MAYKLSVLVMLIWSLHIAAATRTVDCDGGANHTTIAAAISAASAGDTIVIRNCSTPGYYNELLTVNKNNLTFIAETGHAPVLTSNAADSSSGAMMDITADNITIDGLVFDGRGTSNPRYAIRQNCIGVSRSGVTIQNSTFEDWHLLKTTQQFAVIFAATTTVPTPFFCLNQTIRNNTFNNNRGIRILQLTYAKNILIENNTITNSRPGYISATQIAIKQIHIEGLSGFATFDSNAIVRYNYIGPLAETREQTKTALGVTTNTVYAHGIDCDISTDDGEVYQNYIVGDTTSGFSALHAIYIESGCHGWVVHDNYVKNVYNGVRFSSSFVNNNKPGFAYRNVVVNHDLAGVFDWATEPGTCIYHQTHATYLYNNICYETGTTVQNIDARNPPDHPAPATGFHYDDNDYYSPNDTTVFRRTGETALTFAAWKTDCSCDTASITTDPAFTDVGTDDITLASGSANINSGTITFGNPATREVTIPYTGAGPEIGMEQLVIADASTTDSTHVAVSFASIYSTGLQCTAGRVTVTSPSRGAQVATSVMVMGNQATFAVTNGMVGSDTITMTGVYNACRVTFAGTGSNIVTSRTLAFTNTAVVNTLSGGGSPVRTQTAAACHSLGTGATIDTTSAGQFWLAKEGRGCDVGLGGEPRLLQVHQMTVTGAAEAASSVKRLQCRDDGQSWYLVGDVYGGRYVAMAGAAQFNNLDPHPARVLTAPGTTFTAGTRYSRAIAFPPSTLAQDHDIEAVFAVKYAFTAANQTAECRLVLDTGTVLDAYNATLVTTARTALAGG